MTDVERGIMKWSSLYSASEMTTTGMTKHTCKYDDERDIRIDNAQSTDGPCSVSPSYKPRSNSFPSPMWLARIISFFKSKTDIPVPSIGSRESVRCDLKR